jgi:hypothetical protein
VALEEALIADPKNDCLMLDTTLVRAHQRAATVLFGEAPNATIRARKVLSSTIVPGLYAYCASGLYVAVTASVVYRNRLVGADAWVSCEDEPSYLVARVAIYATVSAALPILGLGSFFLARVIDARRNRRALTQALAGETGPRPISQTEQER